MTALRLFIYFLDALAVRRAYRQASLSGADLVIFDRYIYDEFANLRLGNLMIRTYIKLLMRFIPRPDISYLLDADPIKARARKPEYPLDFLYTNRQAYLALRDLIGGITLISPMPVQDVTHAVIGHALNDLSFEPRTADDGATAAWSEIVSSPIESTSTRPAAL
jgi:hypothetical protein